MSMKPPAPGLLEPNQLTLTLPARSNCAKARAANGQLPPSMKSTCGPPARKRRGPPASADLGLIRGDTGAGHLVRFDHVMVYQDARDANMVGGPRIARHFVPDLCDDDPPRGFHGQRKCHIRRDESLVLVGEIAEGIGRRRTA